MKNDLISDFDRYSEEKTIMYRRIHPSDYNLNKQNMF